MNGTVERTTRTVRAGEILPSDWLMTSLQKRWRGLASWTTMGALRPTLMKSVPSRSLSLNPSILVRSRREWRRSVPGGYWWFSGWQDCPKCHFLRGLCAVFTGSNFMSVHRPWSAMTVFGVGVFIRKSKRRWTFSILKRKRSSRGRVPRRWMHKKPSRHLFVLGFVANYSSIVLQFHKGGSMKSEWWRSN